MELVSQYVGRTTRDEHAKGGPMKLEAVFGQANWLSGLDRSAKVTDIVPAGFESYLRILHKAHPAESEGADRHAAPEASWAEVASPGGLSIRTMRTGDPPERRTRLSLSVWFVECRRR